MSEPKDTARNGASKTGARTAKGQFAKGNPGKPKGAKAKVPAEFRQAIRDFFDKPETREKFFKRIEADLDDPHHAPTFAIEALQQGIGKPPVDLNLNAGNSLRDALLAAFQRRQGQGPGGTS